jgi:hypothetical protein
MLDAVLYRCPQPRIGFRLCLVPLARRLALLGLGVACCLPIAAQPLLVRDPELLANGTFRVVAESPAISSYLVLWRGDTLDAIVTPVAAALPQARTVLADGATGPASRGFYRLEAIPFAAPRDLDRDGLDDLFELTYPQAFDPLNPADAAGDFDRDGFDNLTEHRPVGGAGNHDH